MLANVLGIIDVNIVGIALPDILRSFPGATLPQVSWVMNGYTVFFAASLLPVGGLADRFGTRRVFLSSVTVFTGSSVGCALAPGVGWLIAARMAQAVGGGGMITLALAIGLAALPGRPAQVLGLISGTAGIAAAAAPTIGGALLVLGGWRAIFFAVLPVACVVLVLGRTLPRPAGSAADEGLPDIVGVLAAAGSVGILALMVVQAGAWRWASARSVGAAVAGVGLACLAVLRALHHPRPAIDLSLLRSKTTAVGNAALIVLSVPQFSVVVCATLFLTDLWHFSPAAAGIALTPGMIASSIAAWASGRMVRSAGARRIAAVGGLVGAAGWTWIALHAGSGPAYGAVLLPGLVLGFAGSGMAGVALSAIAVRTVPRERYSNASALVMLSRSVGAITGIAALASLLAAPLPGHFQLAWLGMAAATVLVAVAALIVPAG